MKGREDGDSASPRACKVECLESSRQALTDWLEEKSIWFMLSNDLSFLSGGMWKAD